MLFDLARHRQAGNPIALSAVCSAHPDVLRSALGLGRKTDTPVLIEATCNQVNHHGGYTGMRPADFVELVQGIADQQGLDQGSLILGGDHLGPNPWRHLPVDQAMVQAAKMVGEFARAGFQKFHLDTSMGCKGEPASLDDEVTASRATRLMQVIEDVAAKIDGPKPAYVIGTEVPPPGGATHVLDHVEPTGADAARASIEVHRHSFFAAGLEDAFSRTIALVVQPGVEFGDTSVVLYDRHKARGLGPVLLDHDHLSFEAHSTDYQTQTALDELVEDGNAILKVGPWLTFVLRETLYGLDQIAGELSSDYSAGSLSGAMEDIMLAAPSNWEKHYCGGDDQKRLLRHFSYSDRIRYYWNDTGAQLAVRRLFDALSGRDIPDCLVSQFMPHLWRDAMGRKLKPAQFIGLAVEQVLRQYLQAARLETLGDPKGRLAN